MVRDILNCMSEWNGDPGVPFRLNQLLTGEWKTVEELELAYKREFGEDPPKNKARDHFKFHAKKWPQYIESSGEDDHLRFRWSSLALQEVEAERKGRASN